MRGADLSESGPGLSFPFLAHRTAVGSWGAGRASPLGSHKKLSLPGPEVRLLPAMGELACPAGPEAPSRWDLAIPDKFCELLTGRVKVKF